MEISPDHIIVWQTDGFALNATVAFTWVVMVILGLGSFLVTRNLSTGHQISPWQNLLEAVVETIEDQIRNTSHLEPQPYLPFIGTLFLFIALSNLLEIVPGFRSPAGSLSTTIALALCVLVAVPFFGIRKSGWLNYLKIYIQPTPIMLPFQIISEISRTVSLAIRLFGNVMSTGLLVAILLLIVPLFLPAIIQLFGLLVGLIQAYVFALLAMVYIASGSRAQGGTTHKSSQSGASHG
ncbi:MAG: F0F1 ATP synthase subunit A [Cyanobacteria bacterium J06641_5]